MPRMEMQIFKKGALYTAECAKCGSTAYSHEWAHADHNDRRDAMHAGTLRCDVCSVGTVDPKTVTDCGRQYAGWYSMPGYLDCTELHYSKNLRELRRELRAAYGN